MKVRGMSERHALRVVCMSASALRYRPAPDRDGELREAILGLAYRHRRYGAEMIYLKLRQQGWRVNHKRVDVGTRGGTPFFVMERLYGEAQLQVRRRRRKKVPVTDRQPLLRPEAANQVWSMDFIFDRVAGGRVIKCLVIVDDATTESVALEPRHAMGGTQVVSVLDRIHQVRGLPKVIRTDNVLTLESSATNVQQCPRAL